MGTGASIVLYDYCWSDKLGRCTHAREIESLLSNTLPNLLSFLSALKPPHNRTAKFPDPPIVGDAEEEENAA